MRKQRTVCFGFRFQRDRVRDGERHSSRRVRSADRARHESHVCSHTERKQRGTEQEWGKAAPRNGLPAARPAPPKLIETEC